MNQSSSPDIMSPLPGLYLPDLQLTHGPAPWATEMPPLPGLSCVPGTLTPLTRAAKSGHDKSADAQANTGRRCQNFNTILMTLRWKNEVRA
jgi:hypothetical protein